MASQYFDPKKIDPLKARRRPRAFCNVLQLMPHMHFAQATLPAIRRGLNNKLGHRSEFERAKGLV